MASPAKVPSEQYLAFADEFLRDHPDVESGSLFGMRCLKRGGKAFAGGFADGLVVKLDEDSLEQATAIAGTAAFDPSGAGRPMRAWVVLGPELREHWAQFAEAAHRASLALG
jgi:hypothetical protein